MAIKEEKDDDESEECEDEETTSPIWNHLLIVTLGTLSFSSTDNEQIFGGGQTHVINWRVVELDWWVIAVFHSF